MDIIIVGCGRVGKSLAEKLNDDGNNVTVIDMSAAKVNEVTARCDVMGVVGNGATHTVLREAGIASAELFIAVTNSDELNLLCCMIAKREGDCQVVARLKSPEYKDEISYLKDELGLAMVINPEYAAAEEIARVLRFPSAMQIEPFAKGKVEMIKFRIPKDSELIGLSVRDMAIKYRADVIVCTIERGEESYIAKGDFVFEEKDIVGIVASHKNANDFFTRIHYKGNSIKSVMVAGGNVITHYLCEILEKSGITLTVLEKDEKTAEELATAFPKVNVIHANHARKDFLLEEGLDDMDAFVALSEVDEENILLSLFAKDVCKGKIVTRINRMDYDSVVARLDLDTTICPKNITADSILRHVRATNNARGSSVETMYNIIQDEVEASEFIVKEGAPIIGIPLSQLKFKADVLVASIYRKGKVIIPRGGDSIQAGDAVVIVTKLLGLQEISDVLR